jgi:hypothetical protein
MSASDPFKPSKVGDVQPEDTEPKVSGGNKMTVNDPQEPQGEPQPETVDNAEANDPSDVKQEAEINQSKEKFKDRNPDSAEEEDFGRFDTGPNRQGNAYGISDDARDNFKRDLEDEKERLERRIKEIDDEIADLGNDGDS